MPGDISARAAVGGDTGSPGAVVQEWCWAGQSGALIAWAPGGVPRNIPVPWCFAQEGPDSRAFLLTLSLELICHEELKWCLWPEPCGAA